MEYSKQSVFTNSRSYPPPFTSLGLSPVNTSFTYPARPSEEERFQKLVQIVTEALALVDEEDDDFRDDVQTPGKR